MTIPPSQHYETIVLSTIFGKDYRWSLEVDPPVLPNVPDELLLDALANIFENPEHFFARLTPSAVDAGLNLLAGPYGIVRLLCEDDIPILVRERYIRAHVPLFLNYLVPKSRHDGFLSLAIISYWSSFVTYAAYPVQHILDDPGACGIALAETWAILGNSAPLLKEVITEAKTNLPPRH